MRGVVGKIKSAFQRERLVSCIDELRSPGLHQSVELRLRARLGLELADGDQVVEVRNAHRLRSSSEPKTKILGRASTLAMNAFCSASFRFQSARARKVGLIGRRMAASTRCNPATISE